MPFSSKGYTQAYKETLHNTLAKFWEWSEGGKYPIVIDTTSCAHSLRTCQDSLEPDDLVLYQKMTLLDSLELIHDTLLPRLDIHPVDEDVVLHPNCSARKLGLDGVMLSIAEQCAKSATVPFNLGCCAFAAHPVAVKRLHGGEAIPRLTFWSLVVGTVLLGLVSFPRIMATPWAEISTEVYLAILFLGVCNTAFTFFLAKSASVVLSPPKVMAYTFLIPGLVGLLEGLFGTGWPEPAVIVGVAITALAMLAMLRVD